MGQDIEINRFIEKGINVKLVEVNNISYAVDYPEDIAMLETFIDPYLQTR